MVKSAYDILIDMEKRETYNKLGAAAFSSIRSSRKLDSNDHFLEIGIYYFVNGVLTYLLTLGKQHASARTYSFCALVVMLLLEIMLIGLSKHSGGLDLPSWLMPQMTEYEIVQMFHRVFPVFMNGCRLVSKAIFVDIEKQTRAILVQLLGAQQMMCIQLKSIETEIVKLRCNNSSVGGGESSSSTSGYHTVTNKLLEIGIQKARMQDGIINKATREISSSEKRRFSIPFPTFWLLITAYSVYYYFTQK